MSEQILQIISGIAKKSAESLEATKTEQGLWDSLLHVELIFALEAEFNIFFEPEDIALIDTPEKVIEVVLKKVAAREA